MLSPFDTLGRVGLVLIAAAGMTACAEKEALERYPIGGTVSGLVGSVVLQNNGGDDLSVEASGAFRFTHAVRRGDGYNVTILTQPEGQTCTVHNGSGVASMEVVDVTVICSGAGTTTYTIGGTVSGLNGEVVLRNVGENLTVSANGAFTFATRVPSGTPYVVSLVTQPVGQVCRVANNIGTVGTANVTNVAVTCSNTNQPTYTIGGTVSGLDGVLVLLNGTQNLTVAANGTFAFPTPVPTGTAYAVSVATQPAGQTCTVTNGSGTVGSANVTSIAVTCTDDTTPTNFYSIGGTVSGLKGDDVALRNGTAVLTVGSNGPFVFPTTVQSGTAYAVSVATQPAGQTCTVANASGTVGTANVTNVAVTCSDTTQPTYTIGGTVSGLKGDVVLRNGAVVLTVRSNGPFAFPTTVQAGTAYAVSVATQPAGQTCTVANGSGTVGTANVTNVAVTCSDTTQPTYTIGGTVSGLSGGTLELHLEHPDSAGSSIEITTNGSFIFPDQVEAGDTYTVSVLTQPADQTCSVTNGSGRADANITNVAVSCVGDVARYSVGGTIEGLLGSGLTLEQGVSNAVSPEPGAITFTLPEELEDEAVFNVGISSQPAGQTCVITRAHGAIAAEDVTQVHVTCIVNANDPLVGTFAVSSDGDDSLAYLTLFGDGVYIYGSVENDAGCGGTLAGNGVEYGVYGYDEDTGAFTIRNAVVDTNGACGVWNGISSRFTGLLASSRKDNGKGFILLVPGSANFDLDPVESKNGELYGSFADPYQKNVWLFADAGDDAVVFFNTQTQADEGSTSLGYEAGIEYGCGTIDGSPDDGTLLPDLSASCQAPAPNIPGAVDTNGTSGLSRLTAPWDFDVNGDELTSPTFRGSRVRSN